LSTFDSSPSPQKHDEGILINNDIETLTFKASAATEITNMKSSDLNFSDKQNILLYKGPDRIREGMLKFEVKGVRSRVLRAKLKVYVEALIKNTPSKPVTVRGVSAEWDENIITWDNCPALENWFGEFRRMPIVNDWMEADVTEYVKGDGIYSFRLGMQEEVRISVPSTRYDARYVPYLEIICGTGELPPEKELPQISPIADVLLKSSECVCVSSNISHAVTDEMRLAAFEPESVVCVGFDVKNMNCDVLETKLNLYYDGGGEQGSRIFIYSAGNNWEGTSITLESMPMALPERPIAKLYIPSEKGWMEFDLKNCITGTGRYSFIIKTNSRAPVFLRGDSNETGTPMLFVKYREGLNKNEEEVEKNAKGIIERYFARRLIASGIIDVTKPPYCADNTGKKDATLALQRAINESRDTQCVTYLPAGTYLVSSQLEGRSPDYTNKKIAKKIMSRKSFGCILKGPANPDSRAVIKLLENAEGFMDPKNPEALLYFWAIVGMYPNIYSKSNINWSSQIIDIDIDLNQNPGAIGIDFAACELSALQCVRVNAKGAFAGIKDGLGSGGGMHDITVTGGKYGVYITKSQPTCSLSNATLKGQTCACIYNDSAGPLIMPGAVLVPEKGASAVQIAGAEEGSTTKASVCLVDSMIETYAGGDKPAIYGNRSVYMNNVYVKNAEVIVDIKDAGPGYTLLGNKTGWSHVKEFAGAAYVVYPESQAACGTKVRRDSIYIDGTQVDGLYKDMGSNEIRDSDIPRDLQSRHTWSGIFPYWGDKNILNAKDFVGDREEMDEKVKDCYPELQKAIDEASRRGAPLFIPKGVYKISKTLELRANSCVVGASHLSVIIEPLVDPKNYPDGDFLDGDNPKPLIKTVDDKDAAVILAFMQLHIKTNASAGINSPYSTSYGLLWRAGRNSIIRNVFPRRVKLEGPEVKTTKPPIVFTGGGGGRAYVLSVADATRMTEEYYQCLIDGTTEPLKIYHYQPQMGDIEAVGRFGSVFTNAKNIDVFGVKFEGSGEAIIKAEGCENIRIFGCSGGGSPESYFKLTDCKEYVITNIFPMDGKIKLGYRDMVWDDSFGTGDISHIIMYKRTEGD